MCIRDRTISERLKYVRKMRGFTQESLAAAIGASRGVITNIEYGKVEPQPVSYTHLLFPFISAALKPFSFKILQNF